MDRGSGCNTALVFISFLSERGYENQDLRREIESLEFKVRQTQVVSYPCENEDEDLQTDGHFCSNPQEYIGDERPRWREDPAELAIMRGIAANLNEIADQLERSMVSRATKNLTKTLTESAKECWRSCLSREVETLLKRGVGQGLEQLPQERLLVALTFTLVRGVSQCVPRLLNGLFDVALQYVHDRAGW